MYDICGKVFEDISILWNRFSDFFFYCDLKLQVVIQISVDDFLLQSLLVYIVYYDTLKGLISQSFILAL